MKRLARLAPLAAALAALVLLGGCTVGPKYERPEVPAPAQHRFVEGPAMAESMADLPWWKIFKDPRLQALLREAVANNLDLRAAAARVEEARARAGVAKSFLYPQLNVGAGYSADQVSILSQPPAGTPADKTYQNWSYGFTLSWDIDLFGRIRREKESAIAAYLATEEGRRGVIVALVADTASTYFLLQELDLQLEIARRTVQINDETVVYYQKRLQGGISNRLEVDQAQANRARTASAIPEIERQIAVAENALSLLLGRPPGRIERGTVLSEGDLPPQVPAGLPAALLERRPDVLQAEQALIAANADVGAAKALYFPTISLTGLFGGVSHELGDLAKGDALTWNLSPGLLQPVFQGGRIKRNHEAAQARYQQALALYRKAALNSYREVADALIGIEKFREAGNELGKGVEALTDAAKLSRSRYDTGLSSYIEVLIADQQLFEQELRLAQSRGDEARAVVGLYRALGGGWEPEPVEGQEVAGSE